MTPAPVEQTYDPAVFDQAYYDKVVSGGNPRGYRFDDPQQQEQLSYKWEEARALGYTPANAFFVGCARGFEVLYWLRHGVDAFGMDVSAWAIAHAEQGVCDRVYCHAGGPLGWPGKAPHKDDAFSAVLAFDVLTLIPQKLREALVAEMIRIAGRGILVRTTALCSPADNRTVHGLDGVPFRLETMDYWRVIFTGSGKFKLGRMLVYDQPKKLELVLAFNRREKP